MTYSVLKRPIIADGSLDIEPNILVVAQDRIEALQKVVGTCEVVATITGISISHTRSAVRSSLMFKIYIQANNSSARNINRSSRNCTHQAVLLLSKSYLPRMSLPTLEPDLSIAHPRTAQRITTLFAHSAF